MAAMTFEGVLEQDDNTSGTFIEIPADIQAVFGRARPRVLATINGHTWRTTIAVYGGKPYLGISRVNRDVFSNRLGRSGSSLSVDTANLSSLPNRNADSLRCLLTR